METDVHEVSDDCDFEPSRFTVAFRDEEGYMDYAFFYAHDQVHAEEKFASRYPDFKILEVYPG